MCYLANAPDHPMVPESLRIVWPYVRLISMTNPGDSGDTAPSNADSSPGRHEAPPIDLTKGQPDAPPTSGYPQPSYPPPGYAAPYDPTFSSSQAGYPPSGYPGPTYPPPSYPSPGYPGAGYPGGYLPGAPRAGTNTMAIASLVTSIVGLPLAIICFIGVLGSIAGVVLGVVALNQIKQTNEDGRGLAIGGIAVGGFTLVLGAILVIVGVGLTAINS